MFLFFVLRRLLKETKYNYRYKLDFDVALAEMFFILMALMGDLILIAWVVLMIYI